MRATKPAASVLGLWELDMEGNSWRAGSETAPGGKAVPLATFVHGASNTAAAAAAAAAMNAAGDVTGVLSVDVLNVEDPGLVPPPVSLAAASACLLRRMVARSFSTAAFFFSLADRARLFGTPDELAGFLEPPSWGAMSASDLSPESIRKSRWATAASGLLIAKDWANSVTKARESSVTKWEKRRYTGEGQKQPHGRDYGRSNCMSELDH